MTNFNARAKVPLTRALILLILGLCLSAHASAVELRSFKSDADRARFNELSKELRCLVCQNQSLADSDADLAQDLRRQVHEMVEVGKSNTEITDYMVKRYGNFILYKPAFNATTVVLWVGPFVLAVLALSLLFRMLKKRRAQATQPAADLTDTERAKLDALLHGNNKNGASS